MKRYKFFNFKKVEESKNKYQKTLLNSSFENKISSLRRLQEKGIFFNQINYKFSESFSMEKIIKVLDDLKDKKLIKDYVIGGATALLFYSTPMLTEDIDVFITIEKQGLLIDLSDIYTYLKKTYNAKVENEYILIFGNPIQFLMSDDKITTDAIKNANEIKLKGVKFKVFSFEYLISIMLYLNKPKYRERLLTIKTENKYDAKKLNTLLNKYNLLDRWDKI